MRFAAELRAQWPYLVGALGLGGVIYAAIATRPFLSVVPAGPPPPKPEDPPEALRWIAIGAPYRLFHGDTYRAGLDVPWGAGWLVTPAKIVEGASKLGFVDVTVSESRPADWPDDVTRDRYVEATWGLDDRIVAGDSHIKAAWRRTRA